MPDTLRAAQWPHWQHPRRRLELTGATPEQRAEIAARARRVRGELLYVSGTYENNRRHRGVLPVLNAEFSLDDLTPRAAARVILASAITQRLFFSPRQTPECHHAETT